MRECKSLVVQVTRFAICALIAAASANAMLAAEVAAPDEANVFLSGSSGGGSEGYDTYRIPSVIETAKGTLLAFCEGRKKNRSDSGDIDLVLKRSGDGGKTWSDLQVVWGEGTDTWGNPCPVIDRASGNISLLLTWNRGDKKESAIEPGFSEDSRRVFVMHSTDGGQTWSKPANITEQVKKPEWNWFATGPGAGIQLAHGTYAGRLVIPCDHKVRDGKQERGYSHVIFSTTAGKPGSLAAPHRPISATNAKLSNLVTAACCSICGATTTASKIAGSASVTTPGRHGRLLKPTTRSSNRFARPASAATPGPAAASQVCCCSPIRPRNPNANG